MTIDVRESSFTFSGGSNIGIGTRCPGARLDVGEGGASCAGDTVGIGVQTPCYRLEVKIDGERKVNGKTWKCG